MTRSPERPVLLVADRIVLGGEAGAVVGGFAQRVVSRLSGRQDRGTLVGHDVGGQRGAARVPRRSSAPLLEVGGQRSHLRSSGRRPLFPRIALNRDEQRVVRAWAWMSLLSWLPHDRSRGRVPVRIRSLVVRPAVEPPAVLALPHRAWQVPSQPCSAATNRAGRTTIHEIMVFVGGIAGARLG